ncbi:hypothetical protein B0T16DRAFT_459428 [Cercophora newfieldiana]|uniref:Uncharacterized protein n=1 Tax=Cercophora newfieldiana TaxID=92897 RepID=A0AA39XZN7_9PEZI|nr:hypothetical protein B0T16DRAFT_459428 [Cercophora newfieldiana]
MAQSHRIPLTDEKFACAIGKAAEYFTEPLSDWIKTIVPGSCDLYDAIYYTLDHLFGDSKLRETHPATMEEFIALTEHIFTSDLLSQMNRCAKEYDIAVGIAKLSDCFIQARPAIGSVEDLIDLIIIHCGRESSQSLQEGYIETPGPESFYGQLPCHIVNIRLRGRTLTEAWESNEVLNTLEQNALQLAQFNPAQTPFRPLPVFHGTDALIRAMPEHVQTALCRGRAKIWRTFRTIHDDEVETWPDVLHCREFGIGQQQTMLSTVTTQLWRSAWTAQAVESLLTPSHERTYAITFDQVIEEPVVGL